MIQLACSFEFSTRPWIEITASGSRVRRQAACGSRAWATEAEQPVSAGLELGAARQLNLARELPPGCGSASPRQGVGEDREPGPSEIEGRRRQGRAKLRISVGRVRFGLVSRCASVDESADAPRNAISARAGVATFNFAPAWRGDFQLRAGLLSAAVNFTVPCRRRLSISLGPSSNPALTGCSASVAQALEPQAACRRTRLADAVISIQGRVWNSKEHASWVTSPGSRNRTPSCGASMRHDSPISR